MYNPVLQGGIMDRTMKTLLQTDNQHQFLAGFLVQKSFVFYTMKI